MRRSPGRGAALGQSFGGFCVMTYLSQISHPPKICLLTGGDGPRPHPPPWRLTIVSGIGSRSATFGTIVLDAEDVKDVLLLPRRAEGAGEEEKPRPWGAALGQSFGGFCVMTYLSQISHPPKICLLTGGGAPVLTPPPRGLRLSLGSGSGVQPLVL